MNWVTVVKIIALPGLVAVCAALLRRFSPRGAR